MEQYFTVEQIRDMDRRASEEYCMPSAVLMENAGRITAEETLLWFRDNIARAHAELSPKVSVVCGSGNNAGDGFVAARYLHNWGANVTVYLLREYKDYRADAKVNLTVIHRMKVPMAIVLKPNARTKIESSDIVIDAILGTGISGEVKGIQRDMICRLNNSNRNIVAVDIPSGLDGNTGLPMGAAVKADLTVSMGFNKKGFIEPEAKKYTGHVMIADIGYPLGIVKR